MYCPKCGVSIDGTPEKCPDCNSLLVYSEEKTSIIEAIAPDTELVKPKKKSLLWLWITLVIVGFAAIVAFVLFLVFGSSKNLSQDIVGTWTGSATYSADNQNQSTSVTFTFKDDGTGTMAFDNAESNYNSIEYSVDDKNKKISIGAQSLDYTYDGTTLSFKISSSSSSSTSMALLFEVKKK